MSQSTIAIGILLLALILYSIPKIPMSVTTIFIILSMAITGILSFEEAFSGFSHSTVMLVAGMMIIGHACFTSGLAQKIGCLLFQFIGADEKKFVTVILLVASSLAIFLNGALVVALLMPIIDSVVSQSKGTITRKQTYFPLGLASTIGNNLTMISATSMITAAGLLASAGYGELNLFAPTVINLPALLLIIVLYLVFGYKLQKKWFDFKEVEFDSVESSQYTELKGLTWKMVLTSAVMIGVVIAMIAGVHYGATAIMGASLLILTGCISEKDAFKSIHWPTIVIVAGAIGLSKGLDQSGAGVHIANYVIELFGSLSKSPFAICLILCILGSALSNLMSDNATVVILVPIAICLAELLHISPVPFVLATASGIKVAVATPISVAPMTMIQVPGYRFKDYFRIGGLVNLISIVVTCAIIKVVYFM